jgi:hypothetical protein
MPIRINAYPSSVLAEDTDQCSWVKSGRSRHVSWASPLFKNRGIPVDFQRPARLAKEDSGFARQPRPSDGALKQITAGRQVQLQLDVGPVGFDRFNADVKQFGNLL